MPLEKDVSLKDLSNKVLGWNGADIESACRRAGLNSIKRNYYEEDLKKLKITKKDFENALIEVGKAIGKKILEKDKAAKKKKSKNSFTRI